MKVIAIIPALNEEKTVGAVVKQCKPHVNEVVVIDDGSTDGTVKAAKKAGASVVKNIVNRGLGITMAVAYQTALERGADVIIQLDADGQYLGREIPLLLTPIKSGEADMVLGSRLERMEYRMPRMKLWGNRLFTRFVSWLARTKISDSQTGFRALRREMAKEILPRNQYTYTQETIIAASRLGWRIKSVPITFRARSSGESRLIKRPISYAVRSLWILLRTMRDFSPIRFFGIPGLIFLSAGFVLGIIVVVRFIEQGYIGATPSVILAALLVISGVQFIFMGLLADMLRRRQT